MKRSLFFILAVLVCARIGLAQQVPVQEVVLDNGMRVLMVPRKGDPNIAVGWVAHVGSISRRPGITGLSHLFEHMMFKGKQEDGTKEIKANLKVIEDMDRVRAEIRKGEQVLIQRHRLGEISDAKDPKNRSARHAELIKQFEDLTKRERELMVKDEFDKIYTNAGGSGM